MFLQSNKIIPLNKHKKSPSKLTLVTLNEEQNSKNTISQSCLQAQKRTTQPLLLYIICLISQIYTTIQIAILLEPYKSSSGLYQLQAQIITITAILRIIIFLSNSIYMGGFMRSIQLYTMLDVIGILSICCAIVFIYIEIIVTNSHQMIFSPLSMLSYMLILLCYLSYIGNFRLMMIKCDWGKSRVIIMKICLYLFCLFYLVYGLYFLRNKVKLEQHCTKCTPMNGQCQSLCSTIFDCCFNHQNLFIKTINNINQCIILYLFVNLGYLCFVISFMSDFDGVSQMKAHYKLQTNNYQDQNLIQISKKQTNIQKTNKQYAQDNIFQSDFKNITQSQNNNKLQQLKSQNQANMKQQNKQKTYNKVSYQKQNKQQNQQLWKRKQQPFVLFILCNLCELYTCIQIYIFFQNTMDQQLQWKYVWSALVATGLFRITVWCINSIYMAGIRGTFYAFIMTDILGVLTVCQSAIFIGFELVIAIPTKQIKSPLPSTSYGIIFFVYVFLVGNFRIMMNTSKWGKFYVLIYKFKLYMCCFFYISYGLYYTYNKENNQITTCSIPCNPYDSSCQPSCTTIDGASTPCCLDLENLMIVGFNRVNQFFVLFLATGLALFSQLVSYMSEHDGMLFMKIHFTIGIQDFQQDLRTLKYIKLTQRRISIQNSLSVNKILGINQMQCNHSNTNSINSNNPIMNE